MNAFLKALGPGTALSLGLSHILVSQGSRGGLLNIQRIDLFPWMTHWLWPTFFTGTALAWAIVLMIDG